MMHWCSLDKEEQVYQIQKDSNRNPVIIYKHSPRCDLSNLTKALLEESWVYPTNTIRTYLLNVISHKSVSDLVSEVFQEYHQSPQLLLIQNDECVYVADYPDITDASLFDDLTIEIG